MDFPDRPVIARPAPGGSPPLSAISRSPRRSTTVRWVGHSDGMEYSDLHDRPAARAILFDVGSTLVDPDPSARELILAVLNAHGSNLQVEDIARAEPRAWEAVQHLLPFQRYGRKESREFWDAFDTALLENLGIPDDHDLRRRMFEEFQRIENWRLYPDAIDVLQTLRARGYRLGVVSNWEEWLEDLLLALDIHGLFEIIVASGPFGRAKPHPAIFAHALEALNVPALEAVHIGDSPRDDVNGARAAGARPILIDRGNRFADLDVERVAALSDLLPLFPPLNAPA